jgi:hypothetical protein
LLNVLVRRVIAQLSAALTVGHLNYVASTHGANLELSEPFPQTVLMEGVSAVRNLVEFLACVKLLKTYSAVKMLRSFFVKLDYI